MRVLDERFLTVHPRTALWWEQRELCRKCEHLHERVNETPTSCRGTSTSLQCSVTAGKGPHGWAACIEAREEGKGCGPEGKLFSAR